MHKVNVALTLLNTPHVIAPLLTLAYALMLLFDSQATTKLPHVLRKVCLANETESIAEPQKNPPVLQYTILM